MIKNITHDFWANDGDTWDFLKVEDDWVKMGAYPILDSAGNPLPFAGRIEKTVSTGGIEVITRCVRAFEVEGGESVYLPGHGQVVRHDGRSEEQMSGGAGDGLPYPTGNRIYSFGTWHPNSFVRVVESILPVEDENDVMQLSRKGKNEKNESY